MEQFLEIKKEIKKNENIILTAHINPDGDAIGSGLALFLTLKNKYPNKNIRFILQDPIPYTTKFLYGSDQIEILNENEIYNIDLLIFLDSATKERTGKVSEKIKAKKYINIDHHISNPSYGDINCVIPTCSSTSEIIYNFIEECAYTLSKEAGEAIYLGLVNDTGSFSHSNVSFETMQIATNLIKLGVNNNYIVTNFLNANSFQTLKLMGEALTNFEFFDDIKLSYYYLDKKTMNKYNARKEDTEGIVEKILSYQEASVSLFLREENDGKIKGSMRSKHNIDVNKIANIFNGGGHIKAAGFSSNKSSEEILEIIKEKLKESIN